MNKRSSSVISSGVSFGGVCLLAGLLAAPVSAGSEADRVEVDLSGAGWTLWQDTAASWRNDELFLPPVDVKRLPVNPPSGGWDQLDKGKGRLEIAVPWTVEGYLGDGDVSRKDITGVSWWFRTITIPEVSGPRRHLLRFESVRLRAEVFIDQELVGYDLVGNTPFEVDITDDVKPGQTVRLAVRVTDPCGNFSWPDVSSRPWGSYQIPASHGFGGITGRVKLLSLAPVYIDDIYMQNTPAVRDANAIVTVRNSTPDQARGDVLVRVSEKKSDGKEVFTRKVRDVVFEPGMNTVTVKVSVASAALWSPETPVLYACTVALDDDGKTFDRSASTFGFRWFAMDGVGSNAVLRLNGKRTFLCTAISWGFWPVSGMVPTDELIDRQIKAAKDLGLNMLNFHRCIGDPRILERADELGLMYFEEPGGYTSGGKDAFARALCREKLLRMVKRDRSHPSLVIYNMINEHWYRHGAREDDQLFEVHKTDMRDAHAIDPSRIILYASAWAKIAGADERVKLHMRPFDDVQHFVGWFDFHRPEGPVCWDESMYKNPTNHYGRTENAGEVVFWGEEGAVSALPRMGTLKADLARSPYKGWDGAVYQGWVELFEDFFKRKNLGSSFPSIEEFSAAMGAVSLMHQGRKIEDTRICDLNDGYAINGWESETSENLSGIVDCYRVPKADPELVARYNQPVYVAVKPRQQIVEIPGKILVDFYVINQGVLKGPHTVNVALKGPAGTTLLEKSYHVDLAGGDVFSQLVAEGVDVPIKEAAGLFKIEAMLLDADGNPCGTGHDEVLGVDWKIAKLSGRGAVYEDGHKLRNVLKKRMNLDVPAYDDTQGHLDWLLVARSLKDKPLPVEAEYFTDAKGKKAAGIKTGFYKGTNFEEKLHERIDKTVFFDVSEGAKPDPAVTLNSHYSVRWEGWLRPPKDGRYNISTLSSDPVSVWIDNKLIVEISKSGDKESGPGEIELKANQPVPVRIEHYKGEKNSKFQLAWKIPDSEPVDPKLVIERAKRDGTTILMIDGVVSWMPFIASQTAIKYDREFDVGANWSGGQYFVTKHPLFKDLPVDQGMDWPYYSVIQNKGSRKGLVMDGEDLVAGCYHCSFEQGTLMGTAVGVVPCGKGEIVVSTLDIVSNLDGDWGGAAVARKLLCNYIEYAGRKK